MRKSLFFICFLLPFLGLSQNKEKHFFGGQIGILEGSIYNEFDLSSDFSFKTSIGLVGGISNSDFLVYSRVEISPKWNYNINKRLAKNKRIQFNSSNYFSLNISYTPDWVSLSDYKYRTVEKFSIIPTFGLKRNFSNHMHYEFFLGIGYEHYLNSKTVNANDGDLAVRVGALIGFDF